MYKKVYRFVILAQVQTESIGTYKITVDTLEYLCSISSVILVQN